MGWSSYHDCAFELTQFRIPVALRVSEQDRLMQPLDIHRQCGAEFRIPVSPRQPVPCDACHSSGRTLACSSPAKSEAVKIWPTSKIPLICWKARLVALWVRFRPVRPKEDPLIQLLSKYSIIGNADVCLRWLPNSLTFVCQHAQSPKTGKFKKLPAGGSLSEILLTKLPM